MSPMHDFMTKKLCICVYDVLYRYDLTERHLHKTGLGWVWTIQNGWVGEALYIHIPCSTCGWVNRYTHSYFPLFCLLASRYVHVVVHIIKTQNNLDLVLYSGSR